MTRRGDSEGPICSEVMRRRGEEMRRRGAKRESIK
jgi:hypothetical protein